MPDLKLFESQLRPIAFRRASFDTTHLESVPIHFVRHHFCYGAETSLSPIMQNFLLTQQSIPPDDSFHPVIRVTKFLLVEDL